MGIDNFLYVLIDDTNYCVDVFCISLQQVVCKHLINKKNKKNKTLKLFVNPNIK